MSTATLMSRVTGFLRIWATAYALGATGLMSAYSVANNVPNMIFELVAGGIIASLFIPSFLELRETEGDEAASRFASHVLNLTVLALGLVAVVGTLWPQPFIWTQTFRHTSTSNPAVVDAANFFFRFFAVQVVLYGAGSVISGLLNSQRQYLWPSVAPIFNNIVAIITMLLVRSLVLHDNTPAAMVVLAVGTTSAVVVMFAVQIPALVRTGWRHSWGLGTADPAIRRMLLLAVPTVAYVATNLVAVSFRNASALAVSEKGVSVLAYAWVFYQLPYGILAVALATAVFTELADSAGRREWPEFRETFGKGLRMTGVLMLPASALLIALATPLVSLYRIGEFQQEDVALVVGALRWWAAGLIFYASTMFVLRAFYSLKDTRTPMLVNLATTAAQIALYLVLTTGLAGWPGIGIDGIPIADAVFFALTFVVLAALLRNRVGGYDYASVTSTFARMALASVVGGTAAWCAALVLSPLVDGVGGALVQIAVGGTIGLTVAFLIGRLLGVDEVAQVGDLLRRLARRVGPGGSA